MRTKSSKSVGKIKLNRDTSPGHEKLETAVEASDCKVLATVAVL